MYGHSLKLALFFAWIPAFCCSNLTYPGSGVVGDGITDDTAAINANWATAAGCQVHFTGTHTYLISAQLPLPSHTHIVADATATIIRGGATLGTGQIALLTNANWAGNFDISITGGIWDANKRGGNTRHDDNTCVEPSTTCIQQAGNSFEFIHANWIQVSNVTIKDSVVLGILFSGCVHFGAAFVLFDEPTPILHNDGVDVYGPSSEGIIHDITGTLGDDAVALLADDIIAGDPTTGDISDIQVYNVNITTTTFNGLKLLVNQANISNVSAQNYSGTYATSAGGVVDFITNSCGGQGGTISNVKLDQFSATASTGRFIFFQANVAGPVTYSNVAGGSTTISGTGGCTASASPGAFSPVNVMAAQPVPSSIVRGQATMRGQAVQR